MSAATRRLSAAGLAVVAGLALVVVSCKTDARDSASDDGTVVRKPVAYHPESFPDIPFERLVGYRLTADDRQLAVAVAGGALRRLSLVFITRPGDEPKEPKDELDRIAGGLGGLGWRQVASTVVNENRWIKGDETLVVAASLDDGATTISFHLIPQ